MSWLRWQGFAIFASFISLVVFVVWLVAEPIVESTIETLGSEAVGAKVDLDDVDIGWFAGTVSLHRLQVTNPNAPMTNWFEAKRIGLDINLEQLLWRRVHIETAQATGIAFATPRKKSGALAKEDRLLNKVASSTLPELSLDPPSVDDVISSAQLKSVEMANKTKADFAKDKKAVEEAITNLPTKADIENYKKTIEDLKKSGNNKFALLTKAKDFQKVQKAIQNDLAKVNQAKQAIATAKKRTTDNIAATKAAANDDFKRLGSTYTLDASGGMNFVGTLLSSILGDRFKQYAGYAKKLAPHLNTIKDKATEQVGKAEKTPQQQIGQAIHFQETQKFPEFLLGKLDFSASLTNEPEKNAQTFFRGTLSQLAFPPEDWTKPTKLAFEGKNFNNIGNINGVSTIDLREPNSIGLDIDSRLKDWQASNLNFGEQAPFSLDKGSINGLLVGDIKENQLNLNINADFLKAMFSFPAPEKDAGIMASIQQAFSEANDFNISANIRGTLDSPEISVSTGLDKIVTKAIKQQLAGKIASYQKELKEKLALQNQGTFSELGGLNGELKGFETQQGAIGDQLNGLLKAVKF